MWQTFGHNHAKNILEKQLENGQFAHAYLFEGQQGVGKFFLAKEFARKIVESDSASPDVLLHDLSEQSSVEEMREFLSRASYSPVAGQKVVAIINNMQLASKSVANSLLKSLEEPSVKTIFILVSSTKSLLPTVLSRTLVLHFNSFTNEELEEYSSLHFKSLDISKSLIDQYVGLAGGSIAKLEKLVHEPEYASRLSVGVQDLHQRLGSSKYYSRLLKANELADLDSEELEDLVLTWVVYAKAGLGTNHNLSNSIRLALQLVEKLKQSLNKKMVIQHFLVNAKV